MNLSDDEITLIVRECARGSAINRDGSTSHRIARAIESKIEAKLREQEPVALYDGNKFYANEKSAICGCADMANLNPVFLHPASIPEGWQLAPVEPDEKMVAATGAVYDDLKEMVIANYKAMLAIAARSEGNGAS